MKRHQQQRIRGLVVKVASRCNLNCSYCYVYNKGDTTFKLQPRFMSDQTVALLLDRVSEYCRQFRLKAFQFVFHGGEPLLAPMSFYRHFVAQATRLLPAYTEVIYSLQTNGVLLNDTWCQTLGELGIRIGVSLDMLPHIHDTYRVDHKGQGSYAKTIAGLQKAQAHKAVRYHPGVLVVMNTGVRPDQFIRQMLALHLRSVNLLFPDRTYADLLSGPESGPSVPYGNWLAQLFDYWFALPVANRPRIRLFQQIINLILGFDAPTNALGRSGDTFLVIETDGSIDAEDSLKVVKLPTPAERLHLRTHSLKSVLQSPLIALFANSHAVLPTGCQSCPIQHVCGGGFMVHRYHPVTGFNNPSSYCLDLLRIITHIQGAILNWLPVSLSTHMGVQAITYKHALTLLNQETNEP